MSFACASGWKVGGWWDGGWWVGGLALAHHPPTSNLQPTQEVLNKSKCTSPNKNKATREAIAGFACSNLFQLSFFNPSTISSGQSCEHW